MRMLAEYDYGVIEYILNKDSTIDMIWLTSSFNHKLNIIMPTGWSSLESLIKGCPYGVYTLQNTKNMFSCCGGKSGASRWDPVANAFKCIDCGTPTSTDPSYAGTKVVEEKPWWTKTPKSCECGAEKAKTTHANWCPLWTGYK